MSSFRHTEGYGWVSRMAAPSSLLPVGGLGSTHCGLLRAVVRPEAEVGVVLERQDRKIADRILGFLRDIRLVGLVDCFVVDARAFVGRRLLGVGWRDGQLTSREQGREPKPLAVSDHVRCPR